MFIWDFVADTVLGQIVDWIYGQIVGFLGDFFMQMGNMGADLFEMTWVQSIVLFFSYLAWALYGVGLVVACFECGIEYQSGRGSIKDTALNAIKGFMAVGLFTTVPVELYKLSVSLQGSFTAGITGFGTDFGTVASNIMNTLKGAGNVYAQFLIDRINEYRNPSVLLAATRLMHRLENLFREDYHKATGGAAFRIDRKRLRRLREKKQAQGHARDDYEQQHQITL